MSIKIINAISWLVLAAIVIGLGLLAAEIIAGVMDLAGELKGAWR